MIGATREGRVAPVFHHRDHYTSAGRPKRPLTREQAEALAERHPVRAYLCRQCDEYHTGHLR